MEVGKILLILVIAALTTFVVWKFYDKFIKIKLGNLVLVTGGLKTGKTALATWLAIKADKKAWKKWKIKNAIRKLLNKPELEEPHLYSNIPIGKEYPFCEMTEKLLKREERYNYESTTLLSEVSLVADSMTYKDGDLNEQLLMFCKLYAHETKGGSLYLDTQSISDCHMSFRRCLTEYIYIESLIKWIPFILVYKIRIERYSDDKSVMSIYTDTTNQTSRYYIIPKKVFKYYDRYCYSILTDKLKKYEEIKRRKSNDLKAKKVLSLKSEKNRAKQIGK